MRTLKARLAVIMDECQLTKAALARAAGVSGANVTHWMAGDVMEISGKSASNLERNTGFRAAWIASGVGPKKVAPSEKDDMINSEERELVLAFRDLSSDQQSELLIDVLKAAEHNRKIVEQALEKIRKAEGKERSA